MDLIIEIAYANLLSPMILFFLIGIVAVIVNSDLKVPNAFYSGYTMIILFTIGIKGGIELRQVEILSILLPVFLSIGLSLFMFFFSLVLLKKFFGFSQSDAISIAIHYGSVSAVTFVAGLSFLDKMDTTYESYISALLVIMEAPAIILGIIYFKMKQKTKASLSGLTPVIKEAMFGKSIFLLLGGIFIGLVANQDGLTKIQPLFGDLFYGVLCIFLLHMGMIATEQIMKLKGIKPIRFVFAIIIPLFGGVIGVTLGHFVGMSVGGAFMLGVLSASASYIAAPAATEQAIPEANQGYSLGSALGITLPFNLIVGIPLYFWLATLF